MIGDAIDRFRAMTELVGDAALGVYKHAVPEAISGQARLVLHRHCQALLDHCWNGVEKEYGIRRGSPFCAVYQANRFCMILVTPDAEKAVSAAANWVHTRPCIAVVVGDAATVFELNDRTELVQKSSVLGKAECWLALPTALTYTTPSWLAAPAVEMEHALTAA